ncbi:hypothetical protein J6A31_05525 [bacterium]|nr:hypothetical protein [bacterium]
MISIGYILRNTDLRVIRSKYDADRFLTENVCPKQEYPVKINDEFVMYVMTDEKHNVSIFSKRGDIKSPFVPVCEETKIFEEAVDWIYKYRKYINAQLLKND